MTNVLNDIRELKGYTQNFRLWKRQWDNYPSSYPFKWHCVKFDRKNQSLIPDVPGIYAFFIEPRIAEFPCHGYLMYIGLAGHQSENTLHKRYQQYLSEKVDFDRTSIYWLLNNWEGYIYFYYAMIETSDTDLKKIEELLLDTFLPPYVKRGFSAKISNILGAFTK